MVFRRTPRALRGRRRILQIGYRRRNRRPGRCQLPQKVSSNASFAYGLRIRPRNGLKRVCMSDKSNAMTFAHDLCSVSSRVRQEFAELRPRTLHRYTGDEIVRDPRQFDVIGPAISSAHHQRPGAHSSRAASASPLPQHPPRKTSLFRAGTWLRAEHRRKGSPIRSLRLAAAMMLESWAGNGAAALREAVRRSTQENYVTPDLAAKSKRKPLRWLVERVESKLSNTIK